MVLAMHAGFAFLEVGTVRHKNQVNALVKIMTDFGFSCLAYFFVGYWIAYDQHFFASAETLSADNGYQLVKFFFLMTFAAAIPAIISGGIAERARFWPLLLAAGFHYERDCDAWNRRLGRRSPGRLTARGILQTCHLPSHDLFYQLAGSLLGQADLLRQNQFQRQHSFSSADLRRGLPQLPSHLSVGLSQRYSLVSFRSDEMANCRTCMVQTDLGLEGCATRED